MCELAATLTTEKSEVTKRVNQRREGQRQAPAAATARAFAGAGQTGVASSTLPTKEKTAWAAENEGQARAQMTQLGDHRCADPPSLAA